MNSRHEPVDVFMFPPETTFRFYALIAVLLGSLAFVWSWFYLSLPSAANRAKYVACVAAARGQRADLEKCLATFNLRWGVFVLACLAATALVILVIHLLTPILTIRRQRLRPLEAEADPELLVPLSSRLNALIEQAGLAKSPRMLIRARSDQSQAFTFGNWFSQFLCLDAGLIIQFFDEPEIFDAKIRHELAHFRNKDINKMGLTIIGWWAFVTITIVMFPFSIFQKGPSTSAYLPMSWRFALIVGIVYLARHAVIRSREFYADARAFAWDGPGGALLAALERDRAHADAEGHRDGVLGPKLAHLVGLLRLHPRAAERVAMLKQPERLMQAQKLLPGIIGLALGIGAPPVAFVLTTLTGHFDASLGSQATTLLYLYPLAGLAAVSIWRDTSCYPSRARSDLVAWALALACAGGIIIGLRLSLLASLTEVYRYPGVVATSILLILFFQWVRSGAYWWLSSGVPRRTLLAACLLGVGLGVFVLATPWNGIAQLSVFISPPEDSMPPMGIAEVAGLYWASVASQVTTLLLVALLWLYLALPRWIDAWKRAGASIPRRRSFQIALWVAVFGLLVVALRLLYHSVLSAEIRAMPQVRIELFYTEVKLATALQGGLALLMSLRRPVATIGEACFCAIVAGELMAVVALAINVAVGGGLDRSFVITTISLFANYGALAAFPASALGAALRFAFSGFRPLSRDSVALIAR